ncbi:MAG: hypothetical protein DMD72_13850 [Gemmatimonadetes bacterium]|nr:MAG: hypothetical protein DMD72_13850 [Gemmatimonadota bacterium]
MFAGSSASAFGAANPNSNGGRMTYRIAFPMLALLAASGCSGTDATRAMSPDVHGAVRLADGAALSESFPRSGALHVTKNCLEYTRLAGEAGSKVIYATAADLTLGVLDSDIVLDSPGPGDNMAFGHVHLAIVAGVGTLTFSGGTGKFTHFHGAADITRVGAPALRNWAWDGSYSFDPRD